MIDGPHYITKRWLTTITGVALLAAACTGPAPAPTPLAPAATPPPAPQGLGDRAAATLSGAIRIVTVNPPGDEAVSGRLPGRADFARPGVEAQAWSPRRPPSPPPRRAAAWATACGAAGAGADRSCCSPTSTWFRRDADGVAHRTRSRATVERRPRPSGRGAHRRQGGGRGAAPRRMTRARAAWSRRLSRDVIFLAVPGRGDGGTA